MANLNPPANPNLDLSILSLVSQSGPIAKAVLFTLVGCSILSWAVILTKKRQLRLATQQSEAFLKWFWQASNLDEIFQKTDSFQEGSATQVFRAGFKEFRKCQGLTREATLENVQRSLSRATSEEIHQLEQRLGSLASIASAAPFIGLFGTVWGIMNSFQGIGASGSANLAVVAPGISEALITTAAGLFAAIPAVIAYNLFTNQIRVATTLMENFQQDFLNLLSRQHPSSQQSLANATQSAPAHAGGK